MSDDKAVSRRWLMMTIGVLLNGAVALLIATPVVGYLLGPIRKNGGYDSWIDLGDFSQFPLGQTRLASFVNPKSMPWDGATSKAACWVRRVQDQKFQVFAINCAHLGCPVRWFPQSELFMLSLIHIYRSRSRPFWPWPATRRYAPSSSPDARILASRIGATICLDTR